MNIAYVYLQIYRLFDKSTPIKSDCGVICQKACCKDDDSGMYLFPGEKEVFRLLSPSWAKIEKTDFCYKYSGKEKNVPLLVCKGSCDRYQRPLACRIFPLTPYINNEDKIEVIVDPRAKSLCPLARELSVQDFDYQFVKNIKKAFVILTKNGEIKEYMRKYSEYIDEYRRFWDAKEWSE